MGSRNFVFPAVSVLHVMWLLILSCIQICLIVCYSCSLRGEIQRVLLLHANLAWRLSPFHRDLSWWCDSHSDTFRNCHWDPLIHWAMSVTECHWVSQWVTSRYVKIRQVSQCLLCCHDMSRRPALFATMSTSDGPSVEVLLTCLSEVMMHFCTGKA